MVRGRLPPRGEPWKRRANVELWLNTDRPILRFVWRSLERSIGKLALIVQIEVESILHEEMARNNVSQSFHQHRKADGKTKRRNSRKKLFFATWNVRSLVENSGDARICRSRPQQTNPTIVDRKLDLLMEELARYNVSVAGIQETKWFGRDVWTAGGYTFLHSGVTVIMTSPLFGTPVQDILGYFAPPCKIFLGNTVSLMVPRAPIDSGQG